MYEYEKKLLLTEAEYGVLLTFFGKDISVGKQVNYYYDTDDFAMDERGVTCRIREKNGRLRATFKSHRVLSDDCSLECDGSLQNDLEGNCFTDLGLSLRGTLVTERRVVLKNASYEMMLDRNKYLGVTDHELEIEYPRGGQHAAERLFSTVCDILVKNCAGTTARSIRERAKHPNCKSRRFFDRLRATGMRADGVPAEKSSAEK